MVGRALLDVDTPWQVRQHAKSHPQFPHDVTGDQWFDDAKFDAYTALGRHIAEEAVKAMKSQRDALPAHLTRARES